jgi:hypothetical protein
MKTAMTMTLGLVLGVGVSCTHVSGGSGGTGAGGACTAEGFEHDECCSVPDHMPCKGFSIAQCETHPYCYVIKARPFGQWTDPLQPVGCRSSCLNFDASQTCGYNPSDPSTCYGFDGSDLPDGWVEVVFCVPDAGQCGM